MSSAKLHIKPISIALLFCLLGVIPKLSATSKADIVIPFELVNGLIILQAEVDGKSGAYLLDTGANVLLIDGEERDQNSESVATAHGEVYMSSRKIAQLKVGSFIQHDLDAHIISLSDLKKELGFDLAGIIGGGYFMPHTLTMDFKNSTILLSAESLPASELKQFSAVGFKILNQIPVVEIEIEGKSYAFAMDSGATVHFLDQKILPQLTSTTELNQVSKVLTLDQATLDQKRFVLGQFKMGDMAFGGHHFLRLDFTGINQETDQAIAGILSLSQMVRSKVVFDFQNQTLYFN